MSIQADSIHNTGGQLAAANDISISANDLTNEQSPETGLGGLVYAGGDLSLSINQTLTNDKSSLIAQGDISINDNDSSQLIVTNNAGYIESEGDINISANTLNNLAEDYDLKGDEDSDGYYGYDVDGKVFNSNYVLNQTLVLEQDEPISTLASMPSFISADGDVNITTSDKTYNLSSVISAQGDINITTNELINETDSIETHGLYRKWGKKWQETYCSKKGFSGGL